MADLTQSATPVVLFTHQAITHPGNVVGDWNAVAGFLSGLIKVSLTNVETTANATGVSIKIEGSFRTTAEITAGEDPQPIPLQTFTGSTTAAETEALSDAGGEAATTTVLAVASTTNLAVGDWIYVRDDDNVGQSEWHEIVAVAANTSVTIKDGLEYDKVQNDDIFDQAQVFVFPIDFKGLKSIRVVFVHQAATGSDIHVKAEGIFDTAIE